MSATATIPSKPATGGTVAPDAATPNEPTLKERADARKAQDEQAYRDAVARFVDGKAAFDDTTMRTINRTGRTMDAFQADVEMLKQRFQAIRDIEAAGKMQGEIDLADKKHAKALQVVEDLRAKHEEELKTAMWKAEDAHSVFRQLTHQRKNLAKGAAFLESTNDSTTYDTIRAKLATAEELTRQYENYQDLIGRADREADRQNAFLKQQFEEAEADENSVARKPEYIDMTDDREYVTRVEQRDNLRIEIEGLKAEIESLRTANVDPLAMRWTASRN